jgi:ABC-type transporter MlaC component
MSRATEELMDMLHQLTAKTLLDEIRAAVAATDKDGNPIPVNPQLFDKALKMLKDNAITAPASNKQVNDLADQLMALDVDTEEAAQTVRH